MAYAAVSSLEQAMDDLLKNSKTKKLISRSDTIFINGLFGNLHSFLRTVGSLCGKKIVDAAAASEERRVKDAAQKLHDLIDSHLLDQLLLLFDHQSESKTMDYKITGFSLLLSHQLLILKDEIRSFLTTLKIAQDQQQQQQRYDCSSSSSDYTSVEKQQNLLVGFDEQIKTLKKWICASNVNETRTTVVGMTGIGKTSLVKHVYNDPDVIEAFETRFFFHIGPQYTKVHEILMVIFNQLGFVVPTSDPDSLKDIFYLRLLLSETISSTKCLFVLDDVWIDDELDWRWLISHDFPTSSKQNRVIIISHISPSNLSWMKDKMILQLLKEDDSWKLLRQTAFTSEDKCSRELEKIGKKIATNCEGLPAAIIQVGENLRGKSIQEWKTLSEKEDPLIITRDDDTPLSKALYFSIMMMPQNLRTMFLYMGLFPKKYQISRSMLIKLWETERLINPEYNNSELASGEFLEELTVRSVVVVEKWTSVNIKFAKSCRLHFTYRSLCVNEAKSEKLFHVVKKYTDCIPETMRSQRRLCFHNNVVLALREVHEWMESVPDAQSLFFFGPKQQYPIVLPSCIRLLKALDALAIRFYEFPCQILALFLLRYLAITCDDELPKSICRLWNLEVLIFTRHHNIKLSNNGPVYLPLEIWKMQKLKHLYCKGFDLPAPPVDSDLVLAELRTLSGVSAHSCTVEVISRIPSLRRVGVQIDSAHDSTETFGFFNHFTSFYQFHSFKCVVVNPNLGSQLVRCVPSFPRYITKISLSGCGFPWEKIEAISTLCSLEVLKLRWYAFCGPVWEVNNSQFKRLEFLLLEDLDIEHMVLDRAFHRLRRVIIRHCYKLEIIGKRFEVAGLVEVDDCSPSFMKEMREWQSNYDAKVQLRSSCTDL